MSGSSWLLVGSDDDPFCVEGTTTWFGGTYRYQTKSVDGAGHFTPDGGYGSWPWVLDWCLDG